MLSPLSVALGTPLALLPQWLSPNHILTEYGFLAVLIVIFAETGLLIGFFLPGDTLLFSSGLLVRFGTITEPLWLLLVAVPIAAILGNLVGYEIGRRAGPALFTRSDSRLFRQDHLIRSHAFFDKYGSITIFLARFVPIVRTFAAVVAGAVAMDRRAFVVWSIIGGVLWTSGLILLGYVVAAALPGHATHWIQDHIDLLLIGVVLVTVASVAAESVRSRRGGGRTQDA